MDNPYWALLISILGNILAGVVVNLINEHIHKKKGAD